MKNRPELWYKLPYSVQESIIFNCELDYCPYEGSNAEATNSILCNPDISSRNGRIIQEYYKQLSDAELTMIIVNNLDSLERQVEGLKQYLS